MLKLSQRISSNFWEIKKIVTSALQHFFVTQMNSTADEALANIGLIVEDVVAREIEEAERLAEEKKKEEAEKKAAATKAPNGVTLG